MSKLSRLGGDLYDGRVSIDFIGRWKLWYAISGLIVIVAAAGLWLRPLDLGIEFVGGTEYRVSVPANQVNRDTADALQKAVAGSGIEQAASPIVTTSGDRALLIQVEKVSADDSERLVSILRDTTGASTADVSVTSVGASWGKEVANRAVQGLVVFLVLVVLLIWAYFRQWKMSVAAIVALAHDIIITVGIYAWSGFEVTPATVTGILTILGFSLYDTVVVFDKVRENTKNLRTGRSTYAEQANLAVNQTLVRSINTSIVALIPVGAILYVGAVQLGSGALKDLALSLFVGMAAGAYSSIFIATPLLAQLKAREKDVVAADKRVNARRQAADRYAGVGVYTGETDGADVPDNPRELVGVDGGVDGGVEDEERRPVRTAPPRRPEASGSGRTLPEEHRPVRESKSSGRSQPERRSRSKRGR